MIERLRDEETKRKLIDQLKEEREDESLYLLAGPSGIYPTNFVNSSLKEYSSEGLSLQQIFEKRGKEKNPEETLINLLIEDNTNDITACYFISSEENIKKQIQQLPWVSFCSDSESLCPEGVFKDVYPHPRAYGSFAKVLGEYAVRQKLISVQEAVRRMTHLPATNLKLSQRGLLKEGFFADVVVFDERNVKDFATYTKPHQFSTGVNHVFVNGKCVFSEGKHTGVFSGRVVHGPGKK